MTAITFHVQRTHDGKAWGVYEQHAGGTFLRVASFETQLEAEENRDWRADTLEAMETGQVNHPAEIRCRCDCHDAFDGGEMGGENHCDACLQ